MGTPPLGSGTKVLEAILPVPKGGKVEGKPELRGGSTEPRAGNPEPRAGSPALREGSPGRAEGREGKAEETDGRAEGKDGKPEDKLGKGPKEGAAVGIDKVGKTGPVVIGPTDGIGKDMPGAAANPGKLTGRDCEGEFMTGRDPTEGKDPTEGREGRDPTGPAEGREGRDPTEGREGREAMSGKLATWEEVTTGKVGRDKPEEVS